MLPLLRSDAILSSALNAWVAPCLTLLLLTMGCQAASPDATQPPANDSAAVPSLTISADEDTITLRLASPIEGKVSVFALLPHESFGEATGLVYSGPWEGDTLALPRQTAGRDLLFHRFVIADEQGQPLTDAQWVTDVDGLTADVAHEMAWPTGIKGVSNPVDFDDLVDLDIKHVHVNFLLPRLFLPDGAPDPGPEFTRKVNGHTLRFSPQTIAEWDADLIRMTNDGINVVAVFLNALQEGAKNTDPLVHPDTDIENAPFNLGAFSLDDAQATSMFIGALSFMAERYSRADKKYGWIGGYIIGNEVDSHWTWHNMGPVDMETLAVHHVDELRLAWLAIRQHHADPGVYISLTHSWARPNSRAALKNCGGKELLIRITELSRAGGDFGWAVAYHPYPQNLFEPRFWNDQMAMFGYDSPMITFKNIELLPEYLKRPEMTFQGQARQVILSEQGLHMPKGEAGELVQAAAIALAYYRIQYTPGIDAFILHRHVDVEGEGGLLLGLRHLVNQNENPTLGETVTDGSAQPLGAKKKSWYTFQAAETDAWPQSSDYALAVAGYDSWEDALPRTGPFPEHAPEWESFQTRQNIVFDLLELLPEAEVENALQTKRRLVGLMDGGMAESLFLHPLDADQPPATATYRLDLPAGGKPALQFQTYLGQDQGDGVTFRIRVNGELVFAYPLADQKISEHTVDLSAYAGQTVSLTLEVDPNESNHYDEAQWLTPAIINLP
ncbi:MAG: DUF5722 domain-containing protein [Planctomycetota bacterium]